MSCGKALGQWQLWHMAHHHARPAISGPYMPHGKSCSQLSALTWHSTSSPCSTTRPCQCTSPHSTHKRSDDSQQWLTLACFVEGMYSHDRQGEKITAEHTLLFALFMTMSLFLSLSWQCLRYSVSLRLVPSCDTWKGKRDGTTVPTWVWSTLLPTVITQISLFSKQLIAAMPILSHLYLMVPLSKINCLLKCLSVDLSVHSCWCLHAIYVSDLNTCKS